MLPEEQQPLGATDYIAPEYVHGSKATAVSDLFSIAVIGDELLSGELPYKPLHSQSAQRVRQRQWKYRSINQFREDLPAWVDGVFAKATQPHREKRYQAMSEFSADLATPNPLLIKATTDTPLLDRDPVTFWKGCSVILCVLALVEIVLLLR